MTAIESSSELSPEILGYDGDAAVIPGPPEVVAHGVAKQLVTYFKENLPSSLGADLEHEYNTSLSEVELSCLDDSEDGVIETENLTTWHLAPGYHLGFVLATRARSDSSGKAHLLKVELTGEPGKPSVTELAHLDISDVFNPDEAAIREELEQELTQEEREVLASL
ncbi:hypothetical protein KC963_04900, partial [Candidatus Saccharibacteria bacterium]|nr:hypothetical protein [Candidatus Saccharibacteria bacterium]